MLLSLARGCQVGLVGSMGVDPSTTDRVLGVDPRTTVSGVDPRTTVSGLDPKTTCVENKDLDPRTTRQRTLCIFHSDVTRWGPQAEGFCSGATLEVLMIAEAHLLASSCEPVLARMNRSGWSGFHSSATPTGRSLEGNSAGVAIFTRKSHLVAAVDDMVLEDASLWHDSRSLRWVCVVLRLKGVSVLLVGLYLITGIGVTAGNLENLQQLLVFMSLLNILVVIAAGWQCTPVELF